MIKSTDISKAIEQEVKRTSLPVEEEPQTFPTKDIAPVPAPIVEEPLPTKSGDTTSWVTLNVGGSAPTPATQEATAESDTRKKYIQYGMIAFVVLFGLLIVMNLKKNN